MKEATSVILSVGATAASTAAAANNDPLMQRVYFWLNVAVLISNTALAIYRAWRDKDKDRQQKRKDKGEE